VVALLGGAWYAYKVAYDVPRFAVQALILVTNRPRHWLAGPVRCPQYCIKRRPPQQIGGVSLAVITD
jgi:hypothetical protein